MTLRSRLLTMTLSMSSGALPVKGWPVAASMSLSSPIWMKTFFCSALYISRPSLSAFSSVSARGLPLATTLSIASPVACSDPSVKPASASS